MKSPDVKLNEKRLGSSYYYYYDDVTFDDDITFDDNPLDDFFKVDDKFDDMYKFDDLSKFDDMTTLDDMTKFDDMQKFDDMAKFDDMTKFDDMYKVDDMSTMDDFYPPPSQPGYAYAQFYDEEKCKNGTFSYAEGIQTETCIVGYNLDGEATGSVYVVCKGLCVKVILYPIIRRTDRCSPCLFFCSFSTAR